MTDSTVRSFLRTSRWWRLAIAMFAVPAILTGLLAMHILASGGLTELSAPQATGAHSAHATLARSPEPGISSAMNAGAPTPVEDCGGMCGPDHNMLSMICVMALLVTAVLLSVHLMLAGWEQLRRVLLSLVVKAVALASSAPPSLHVLSISRT